MPDQEPAKNTLGYHRMMAVAFFGEDGPAVAYMDKQIADAPNGEEERCIIGERFVVMVLGQLEFANKPILGDIWASGVNKDPEAAFKEV